MSRKIKLYLAGSLFSENEQISRRRELKEAKKALPEAEIFSPVAADFNTKKNTMLPSPVDIYHGDYLEISSSDYVIFDMGDKLDEGLNLEIGIICGINECRMSRNIYAIGVMSDIRLATANKYEVPSLGYNHMVIGAFEKHGKLVSSFKEALELIKEKEEERGISL